MPLELLNPLNNHDDRREIFVLLSKMTQMERIAFLEWAVDTANTMLNWRPIPGVHHVKITNNTGEVKETELDLMLLCSEYALDQAIVLRELEQRAAQKKLPRQ